MPLTTNQPYPTTDGICSDAYTLAVVSPAYASSTGELNAILQYIYQVMVFEKLKMKECAETLESIAIAEMIHLKLLGNTIAALGSLPLYCQNPSTAYNFYSSKFVTYSKTPVNMIEDDILSEKQAICHYEKILARIKCEQVKQIISRILDDEKLHLEKLKGILAELKR